MSVAWINKKVLIVQNKGVGRIRNAMKWQSTTSPSSKKKNTEVERVKKPSSYVTDFFSQRIGIWNGAIFQLAPILVITSRIVPVRYSAKAGYLTPAVNNAHLREVHSKCIWKKIDLCDHQESNANKQPGCTPLTTNDGAIYAYGREWYVAVLHSVIAVGDFGTLVHCL